MTSHPDLHDARRYFPVHVRAVADVTPHVRRVTVASPSLTAFPVRLPGQWVKVRPPEQIASGGSGRAYTIRRFDAADATIDMDFVVHGDGPCSTWAATAAAGETIEIAGPRAGIALRPGTRRLLLAGDETALPAIGAMLEVLPDDVDAQAFVEVADPDERQPLREAPNITVAWLYRDGVAAGRATLLHDAVAAACAPVDGTALWCAAESGTAAAIRSHFLTERGFPRAMVTATGYWKLGEADHNE